MVLLLAAGCGAPSCGRREIADWDAGMGYTCTVDGRGYLSCRLIDKFDDFPEISDRLPQDGRWVEIAVGLHHACARDREGYATCWGDIVRTDVAGLFPHEKLSALESGSSTSCGLRESDGSMICMNPTDLPDSEVLDVPEGTFRRLEVMEGRVCYERTSGEVGCQGVYPLTGKTFPDTPEGVFAPVELDADGINACVTDGKGRITCWGRETYGITHPPSGTGYHSLALGQQHACVLNSKDEAVCWGWGGTDDAIGVLDAPSGSFERLLSGAYYTCGERPGGAVECWGCDEESIAPSDPRFGREYCVWE